MSIASIRASKSETADTSARMREVNERFDPLGSKKGI
jgi:hypothetical protein